MKVLLTGANGFVGSHILDLLRAQDIAVRLLLRPTSNKTHIEAHLAGVEVAMGSLTDPASLPPALADITHVIHCAGCTKARRAQEYYEANQQGTRHLLEAAGHSSPGVRRIIYLSSLAAAGPATIDTPARESDPPHPVSEYGRSKLAGEQAFHEHCRSEYVILRPPGVYGPRDTDFLLLFKALQTRLALHFGGGRQPLSLVYVKDLARAVVACLEHPAAVRQTYYVAASEIVTARQLTEGIARQMSLRIFSISLPTTWLWPVCVAQEAIAWLTDKPQILSRLKYPELTAPGWVCDPTRILQELGFAATTTVGAGLAETLSWYRAKGWL
jgi:nucleoside-diphosphate-sugar epimerase